VSGMLDEQDETAEGLSTLSTTHVCKGVCVFGKRSRKRKGSISPPMCHLKRLPWECILDAFLKYHVVLKLSVLYDCLVRRQFAYVIRSPSPLSPPSFPRFPPLESERVILGAALAANGEEEEEGGELHVERCQRQGVTFRRTPSLQNFTFSLLFCSIPKRTRGEILAKKMLLHSRRPLIVERAFSICPETNLPLQLVIFPLTSAKVSPELRHAVSRARIPQHVSLNDAQEIFWPIPKGEKRERESRNSTGAKTGSETAGELAGRVWRLARNERETSQKMIFFGTISHPGRLEEHVGWAGWPDIVLAVGRQLIGRGQGLLGGLKHALIQHSSMLQFSLFTIFSMTSLLLATGSLSK